MLLPLADKTIKLWKISERNVRIDGPLNTKSPDGKYDLDPMDIHSLKIPRLQPTSLMIEASPRKIFANAHTYHINSISINSDDETYISADDLRINLWHLQRTDQSFSILFNIILLGSCFIFFFAVGLCFVFVFLFCLSFLIVTECF